ncbi:MAG: fibronectin type III domain-containing protein [Candidatus Taylorbacteria bacterium]
MQKSIISLSKVFVMTFLFVFGSIFVVNQVKAQSGSINPPSVPTGLHIIDTSWPQIKYLAWTASTPGTNPISGYQIYNGTTYIFSSNSPIIIIEFFPGTTYNFSVRAYDNAYVPNYSGRSNTLQHIVPPLYSAPTNPSAPTNLVLNATSGSSEVRLSWTPSIAGVNPIAGYKIDIGLYDSLVVTATTNNVVLNTTRLVPGLTYNLLVRAYDNAATPNYSVPSNTVQYVALSSNTPPYAPTNLVLETISRSLVKLSWAASTAGFNPIAGYKIYNGTTLLGSSITTSTTTTIIPGTTNNFYVRAYDNGTIPNFSEPSNTVGYILPPSTPNRLVLDATASLVKLSWEASTPGTNPIAFYKIYNGTTLFGESMTTSFVTSLDLNTHYNFSVRAYDSTYMNFSELSNVVQHTASVSFIGPGDPTGLRVTDTSWPLVKNLTWTASTRGTNPIAGYEIWNNTHLDSPDHNVLLGSSVTTSFLITVSPGTRYDYCVWAYDNSNIVRSHSTRMSCEWYTAPSGAVDPSQSAVDAQAQAAAQAQANARALAQSQAQAAADAQAQIQAAIQARATKPVLYAATVPGDRNGTVSISGNNITITSLSDGLDWPGLTISWPASIQGGSACTFEGTLVAKAGGQFSFDPSTKFYTSINYLNQDAGQSTLYLRCGNLQSNIFNINAVTSASQASQDAAYAPTYSTASVWDAIRSALVKYFNDGGN